MRFLILTILIVLTPATHSGMFNTAQMGTRCPGGRLAGNCWIWAPQGVSCTSACTTLGGTYSSATLTYTGSAGSLANCSAVLALLSVPDVTATDDSTTGQSWSSCGCTYGVSTSSSWRNTGAATTGACLNANDRRICACSF